MIIVRRCLLVLVVVGLVALQAACTYKRPEMELEAASASISDSKNACGDVYASDTFNEAQRKLNEAYAAADSKEKGAKELAIEAQTLADKAKKEAAGRGDGARASAEKNLSAARDILANVSISLEELGEDEDTATFSDELSALETTKVKVESQLSGPGCDLLLAEQMSKRLVRDAEELASNVKAEKQRREEEAQKAAAAVLHTVARGECLWRIAEYASTYSDPFLWPLIYSANRDQISDPDLIFPGQVFSIPPGADHLEMQQARRKAATRGPWSLYDGR